jgi:hypothetical protein
VHGLDEGLQEAEKVGDPHQYAETITPKLILMCSRKDWIRISEGGGENETIGLEAPERMTIQSLTGIFVGWGPRLQDGVKEGTELLFRAHQIVSRVCSAYVWIIETHH